MFKIGDRVIAIGNSDYKIGDKGIVTEEASGTVCWVRFDNGRHTTVCEENLKLIGGTMYQDTKTRIRGIDEHTSLKEVDDILQEILNYLPTTYGVLIYGNPKGNSGGMNFYKMGGDNNTQLLTPRYCFSTRCEKLEKFKLLFMDMLDHSDIKKDDRQEKITELEVKMKELQSQIDGLRQE